MEVCVDSLESAIAAYDGGADRIELCASLNEGGLTPPIGLFKCIKKHIANSTREFKIFCMIRPRVGDFLYNDMEINCMKEDITEFVALEADGLVFGALTPEGLVDEELMKEFMKLIPQNKIETTFHRAFDMCSDWQTSLDIIQRLGFRKLLTSGQERTAFDGRKRIREYIDYLKKGYTRPLTVVAGAGITLANLEIILKETTCTEFHSSCRNVRQSQMTYRNTKISMGSANTNEYEIKFTDENKVKLLHEIYKKVYNKVH